MSKVASRSAVFRVFVPALAVVLAVIGCGANGSTDDLDLHDPGDAGLLDGGAGGSTGEPVDASIDGSGGGDTSVDAAADADADADADSDLLDPDGGDGGEAGDSLPHGSIDLCVLNEREPFDTCDTPAELRYGVVAAGTQRMRRFRLDNERPESVRFEAIYLQDHPDFSAAVSHYAPAPEPPHDLVREIVDLPLDRPKSTSLHFDVTFTSRGETAGPLPVTKAIVEITTESNEFIQIEVPIVGEEEACPEGHAACDEDPNNGCEARIDREEENCGACGRECQIANASSVCENGECVFVECNPGWADCDGDLENGCETRIDDNMAHCGGCNRACGYANASAACSGGTCHFGSCDAGWGDCDGNHANGCEAPLDTTQNCGTCENTCAYANAGAACSDGSCVMTACHPDYANCDGDPNNGCERRIDNNVQHCGGCNQLCQRANASATCSNHNCILGACHSGWGNCDGNQANGCEADLMTHHDHCGACGRKCAPGEHCVNGQCRVQCPSDQLECGNICRNPQADRDHCGACNSQCGANQTCNSGICVACSGGRVCGNTCQTTTVNTCSSATNLGTINANGSALSAISRLPLTTQEHWYRVSFPMNPNPNQRGTGTPQIDFVTNGGGGYRFDVYSNCSGSAYACGIEGATALNRTEFSYRETCHTTVTGDQTRGCESRTGPGSTWPATVYIKVKRVSGTGCDQDYRLRIIR